MTTPLKSKRELPEHREITSDLESTGNKLVGYAVVYNQQSELIREHGREFREIILPTAFEESIKTGRSSIEDRPITFVFRHDDYAEYGDTASNLKLTSDEHGVRFSLIIPEYARHLREAIASKRVRGMSFEFYVFKDRWEDSVRYIEKADLTHISAVENPAYTMTNIEIREQPTSDPNWKAKNNLLRKKIR